MRNISLIPYQAANNQIYDVRKSIVAAMFAPSFSCPACGLALHTSNQGVRDLIENDRIARKIETAGDEVLLEEPEYTRVKAAIEAFKGFGRDDLGLINRVMDAPEIDANTPNNGGK